ncbi:Fic/DOC family protein [Pontibacter kalidii]|uniref:Fic/DOC family protein n=1 Tax=Pontibacter kalidii TaxID=2592049 RepID=UPI0022523FF9|nr:Fic family protein [Pontibacter kalidii]
MGEYTTAADDNLLGIADKAQLNELEAKGVLRAEEYMLDLDFPVEITTSLILDIHRTAFGEVYEWAGKWRNKDLQVGSYTPPRFFDIPRLMSEFIYDLNYRLQNLDNNNTNTLVRDLAWAHHKMVHIHPFVNGNGRSARLITDLLAYMHGYQSVELYQREGDGRKKYLQAVKLADTHDFSELEQMIRAQLKPL